MGEFRKRGDGERGRKQEGETAGGEKGKEIELGKQTWEENQENKGERERVRGIENNQNVKREMEERSE